MLSSFLVFNYIKRLEQNQKTNLNIFKEEFIELGRESFNKNSELFFNNLESDNERITDKDKILSYIENLPLKNIDNIIVVDIDKNIFLEGEKNSQFFNDEMIKKIMRENILNQETKFEIDNFGDFLSDTSDSIIPSRAYFRLYEKAGVIVGINQDFSVGKMRIDFIERQNNQLLSSSIKISVLIFLLSVSFIILIVLFIIKRIIINPINSLIKFIKFNKEVNSVKTIKINSHDEIGQLADTFNNMTMEIREYSGSLEKKIRERTTELDSKILELEEKNKDFEDSQKAVINLLEDVENEKDMSEELAKDLEKFKLAVDNVSDHVVITDSEGIVIYGNKAIEKITGYTLNEAMNKKAGTLWKSNKMPKEFYEQMWKTIKVDKEIFVGEIINKRKNGDEYQAAVSISPILDKKGDIIFFVGLEKDITKEKEIDRAKTELISLASHQLRTPLSTINWYTEMLLSGDAGEINEDQKSYLQEIYTGNQRMVDLVNALLNVSRLELGTFMIEPEMGDLVSLGEDVIKEVHPLITQRKQKIEFIHEDNIPEISIDSKLLRMVMQNLLSNSIKYTQEEGNIALSMKLVHKGDEIDGMKIKDDSVLVSVSDNGYGITNSQQDKIFSKLFRADNIKDKSTEGTGLGLYIIKIIIDNSGGQIWFKSEENKGTSFHFTVLLSGMKRKEGTKTLS